MYISRFGLKVGLRVDIRVFAGFRTLNRTTGLCSMCTFGAFGRLQILTMEFTCRVGVRVNVRSDIRVFTRVKTLNRTTELCSVCTFVAFGRLQIFHSRCTSVA